MTKKFFSIKLVIEVCLSTRFIWENLFYWATIEAAHVEHCSKAVPLLFSYSLFGLNIISTVYVINYNKSAINSYANILSRHKVSESHSYAQFHLSLKISMFALLHIRS